jgi:hypothetical protein
VLKARCAHAAKHVAERAPHCATILRCAGTFSPAAAAVRAATLSGMDTETLCNWLALFALLALGVVWGH